ncbi:MAG: carbamoyltransferase HypF [Pseudomonadota bacterium]
MATRADIAHQERLRLTVRGAVQGVGFRPFVWTLARKLDLVGWVLNDEAGVTIEIQGANTQRFLETMQLSPPPLSRIDAVDIRTVPATDETAFALLKSTKSGAAKTAIGPDAATCPDCLADIFDPKNRRHGYAFTNCTHCGPRYTITSALPYDRAQTSMAKFAMCPTCQSEYEDPADRRFHAQPNACPDCGPQLSHTLKDILGALQAGQIVALKGLGGFHLAVDARNHDAVKRLRARKQRDGKPLAVMVSGTASARKLAHLDSEEEAALTGRARPVVIAKSKPSTLSPAISNGLPTLGLMLPYTPLHFLLFHAAAGAPAGLDWLEEPQPFALVMTSANVSGDPLVIDNAEAHARLEGVADIIVTHDRDIVVRADDSVVRVIDGAPRYLRRARGATPTPIPLRKEIPPTLAVGGHLKNTVCLTRGKEAFVSQHIGDLESPSTYGFFKETVAHLSSILEVNPARIACDLHPDFMATRYAEDVNLPLVRVQHHHAHIAAVMAEYQLDGPCLGLALDGFGLGENGESWGGELLLAHRTEFRRLGHFMPLAQPGGDVAARQPWRMGAAALHALGCNDQITQYYSEKDGAHMIAAMLERRINTPMTSSAGRLFDAACGLLGIVPDAQFEGEAPMHLEALVTKPSVLSGGWNISDGVLDMRPLLLAMTHSDPQEGANLFHGTLIAALADWIGQTLDAEDLTRRVALSGGCFQNKVLAQGLITALQSQNIKAYLPLAVPANDGGLSLGQAWIAGQMSLT